MRTLLLLVGEAQETAVPLLVWGQTQPGYQLQVPAADMVAYKQLVGRVALEVVGALPDQRGLTLAAQELLGKELAAAQVLVTAVLHGMVAEAEALLLLVLDARVALEVTGSLLELTTLAAALEVIQMQALLAEERVAEAAVVALVLRALLELQTQVAGVATAVMAAQDSSSFAMLALSAAQAEL